MPVYLLHFEEPYYHAQHYLGYTEDVEARFARHDDGNGSPLLRAVAGAGIAFRVVRTWEGDRKTERALKRGKNNRRLCPVCRPARRANICRELTLDNRRGTVTVEIASSPKGVGA